VGFTALNVKVTKKKKDTMDISEIQHAIDKHCPRRARHLCLIYAEEHSEGTREDFERIYKETKQLFGLDNMA
jgi:hypothetical protein